MELPVLYKQGARTTLVWTISFDPETCELVTMEGPYEKMTDGALRSHRRKVETNQSGRTLEEQAELEMKSKWKKKIDDGYMEKFTDYSILTKMCMLANSFKMDSKSQLKNFPVVAQPKLDGVRCIAIPDDDNFLLRTREKKIICYLNHIRKDLSVIHLGILESLKKRNLPPIYRLDGELYTLSMDFEKLNGIVRFTEKKKPDLNEEKIFYWVFDIDLGEENQLSYLERYDILLDVLGEVRYPSVDLIENYKAKNKEDIKKLHDKFVKEGYEGVIIRKISEPKKEDMQYLPRRCSNILKYKEFVDGEFEIIGAKEGKGIEEGMIIWELLDHQGKAFSCRPKGTHEYRKERYRLYLQDPTEYLHKKYRVRYQGLTKYGTPRFPVGLGICADR